MRVRVLIFSKNFYLSKLAYSSPSNNPVAWDGLPGGAQRINGQIDLAPGKAFGWQLYGVVVAGYSKNVALANTFCFVPSASALDVPVLNNNTVQASYVNGFTSSTSPPRAEAYIAQVPFFDAAIGATAFNSIHPFFTGRYGQWIYNEMERPFNGNTNSVACDPSPECTVPVVLAITGPQSICGPATYSATGGQGATYTWTTSPAGAFSPATGTGATFSTTSTGSASGQVTVSVPNACGNYTASLPVAVCEALSVALDYPVTFTGACISRTGKPNYAQWTARVRGGAAPYTYTWSYLPNSPSNTATTPYIQGQTGSSFSASSTFGLCLNPYSSTISIRVDVTSGDQRAYTSYYVMPQTNAVLFPNPADEFVEIANTDPALTVAPADQTAIPPGPPLHVSVYNAQGKSVFTSSPTNNASLRVSTQAWPADLYHVVIRCANITTQRQLSVQH